MRARSTSLIEITRSALSPRQHPIVALRPEIMGVLPGDAEEKGAEIFYSITHGVLRVRVRGPLNLATNTASQLSQQVNKPRREALMQVYYRRLLKTWLEDTRKFPSEDIDVEHVFGEDNGRAYFGLIGLKITVSCHPSTHFIETNKLGIHKT